MNNIFEGALFGDKFLLKTSIGVYIGDRRLYIKGYGEEYYTDNGIALVDSKELKGLYDIVSRYQESIDEEKLDELAIKAFEGPWKFPTEYHNGSYVYELIDAYKTGYRKAKKN